MTKTFILPHSLAYAGNRPWADVKISPSHPASVTYKCLVDTGADYLLLPMSAANLVGITPAGRSVNVSTAAGVAAMILEPGVDVEIEGLNVTVSVLFDPTNTTRLVAGRNVLLAAFEFGFDVTHWHHD